MMFAEELFLENGKYIQLFSLGLFLQSVAGKRFFQIVPKCVPLSHWLEEGPAVSVNVLQANQPDLFPYTLRSGQEIL